MRTLLLASVIILNASTALAAEHTGVPPQPIQLSDARDIVRPAIVPSNIQSESSIFHPRPELETLTTTSDPKSDDDEDDLNIMQLNFGL